MDVKFLNEYLNGYSPTGFECELGGQMIWINQMEKYTSEANIYLDNYGTAYATMGNTDSNYKVVIEAHCDEISWFVHHIDDKGFIKVIRNGGSDHQIAPSKKVILWGDKGPVNGIFGHPAIHIKERSKEITIDNIFIDVGCSTKEEVLEKGIDIGTVITFTDELIEMGDYYVGRALDNKIGGFIISEVARRLSENEIKLDYKLYVVNSVQEEIGLKGAHMIAQTIKPDVAIITDVCHETTSPAYNEKRDGDVKGGKGGVVGRAPAIHNNLRKLIVDSGKNENIPYQLNASSTSTGTDTESFAYSNGGVPSALISIPLRYMHTTCEMVHKKDIEYTIDLIYHTLLNIKENMSFKYKV